MTTMPLFLFALGAAIAAIAFLKTSNAPPAIANTPVTTGVHTFAVYALPGKKAADVALEFLGYSAQGDLAGIFDLTAQGATSHGMPSAPAKKNVPSPFQAGGMLDVWMIPATVTRAFNVGDLAAAIRTGQGDIELQGLAS